MGDADSSVPILKISLLGAISTGKTQICSQFINNNFQFLYEPTFEVNRWRRLHDIADNPESKDEVANFVIVELQDFFGVNNDNLEQHHKKQMQSILENIKPDPEENENNFIYINKITMGWMFVMDVSQPSTLLDLIPMIQVIEENEKKKKDFPKTKKLLVANKVDLGVNTVDYDQVDQLKEKYDIDYLEISALENKNILEAVNVLARNIYNEKELWKMESREKGLDIPLAKLKGLVAGEMGGGGGIVGKLLDVVTCTKREKEKKIQINPDDVDSDMQSGDDDIQENIDDDNEELIDGNSDEDENEKKCNIL